MFKALPFTDKIFAVFILCTTYAMWHLTFSLGPPLGMISFIYTITSIIQLLLLKKRKEIKSLKTGFAGMSLFMLGAHVMLIFYLHIMAIGISWSGKEFSPEYNLLFWLSRLMVVFNALYIIATIIQHWTND